MKNQDVSFTSLNIPRGMRIRGRAGHLPEGAKAVRGKIRKPRREMGEPVLESGSSCLSLAGTSNTLLLKPEKAMAPHSGTVAWKIPWTEEPGRLQSMGSQRVGYDRVTE